MACCVAAPFCYRNITPCNSVPTQTSGASVKPFDAATLATSLVVATGIVACGNVILTNQQGADNVINGNLNGAAATVLRQGSTLTISATFDLLFDEPMDNITGLRTYHGYGGILNDSDGFRTARVRVYNAADVLIAGPFQVPQVNGGGAIDTSFGGPIDQVSRITVDEIVPWSVSQGCTGIREFQALGEWESDVVWTCGGTQYTGHITGAVAGVTIAGGNLTQTNGPHTIEFSAPNNEPFTGEIITNAPGRFSALVFDQDTGPITITGNNTSTFAVRFFPVQTTRHGFVDLSEDPIVHYDAMTGEVIDPAGFEIVPCTNIV